VEESSKIADEAVMQAEKTDARISQLSQAASRIGDVVKLITAIAEQTNLLASTPPSKPRAPVRAAGALPSLRRRSRHLPHRPSRLPTKSALR